MQEHHRASIVSIPNGHKSNAHAAVKLLTVGATDWLSLTALSAQWCYILGAIKSGRKLVVKYDVINFQLAGVIHIIDTNLVVHTSSMN